jgi:hypothetical protein
MDAILVAREAYFSPRILLQKSMNFCRSRRNTSVMLSTGSVNQSRDTDSSLPALNTVCFQKLSAYGGFRSTWSDMTLHFDSKVKMTAKVVELRRELLFPANC